VKTSIKRMKMLRVVRIEYSATHLFQMMLEAAIETRPEQASCALPHHATSGCFQDGPPRRVEGAMTPQSLVRIPECSILVHESVKSFIPCAQKGALHFDA
jgi:hypothetical protein